MHLHDLRGVTDGDAGVAASHTLKLRLKLSLIPDQHDLDVQLSRGLDGAFHVGSGTVVPSHRINSYLHGIDRRRAFVPDF
jgi:hypothetical protein